MYLYINTHVYKMLNLVLECFFAVHEAYEHETNIRYVLAQTILA